MHFLWASVHPYFSRSCASVRGRLLGTIQYRVEEVTQTLTREASPWSDGSHQLLP